MSEKEEKNEAKDIEWAEGRVQLSRVLFESDKNDYKIVGVTIHPDFDRIFPTNNFGNITITGSGIPDMEKEMYYDVLLKPNPEAKYECSYFVKFVGSLLPVDPESQWAFVKGVVTEAQYANIKKRYQENDELIVDIIMSDAFDYKSIHGYGEYTHNLLKDKVRVLEEISYLMVKLADYSISVNALKKIVEFYGSGEFAYKKIEENPYILMAIDGFGFLTVDTIALSMGVEKDSLMRTEKCIEYIMSDLVAGNGDTVITKVGITKYLHELLKVQPKIVKKNFSEVIEQNEKKFKHLMATQMEDDSKSLNGVWMPILFASTDYSGKNLGQNSILQIDDNRYVSLGVFAKEYFIAKDVLFRNSLTPFKNPNQKVKMEDVISEFEKEEGLTLSDAQKRFLNNFENSNISFLIGYAGTGKSMSQKIVQKYVQMTNSSIDFIAPTGKASKVLTEYTGQQASTIHRKVLGIEKIFSHNILNDESSMNDISIGAKLLERINSPYTKVVFAGDDAQIPSIGAGNFLLDLSSSFEESTTRYTQVFRQKEGGILDFATKVRKGQNIIPYGFSGRKVFGKNLVFDARYEGTEAIKKKVVETFLELYNSGRWEKEEIVVLSPKNVSPIGVIAINSDIQDDVNPRDRFKNEMDVKRGKSEYIIREGDYIMNTENNYETPLFEYSESERKYVIVENVRYDENGTPIEKDAMAKVEGAKTEIFNGDTGYVLEIDDDKKMVYISMNDEVVGLKKENVAQGSLLHSWAITIYKAQGSEYKVGVIVLDSSSSYQLNANLIYTAITRLKDMALIISDSKTINNALKVFANLERKTLLGEIIRGEVKNEVIDSFYERYARYNYTQSVAMHKDNIEEALQKTLNPKQK